MSFFRRLLNLLLPYLKETDLVSCAFNESPIASLVTTTDGKVLEVNKSFTLLMGYSSSEIVGENMSLLKSGEHDHNFYKNLWKNLKRLQNHSFEIYNRSKNNNILLVKEQIQFVTNNSQEYFIISLEDITQRKEQEQRQQHLATHDPLTGLANRALLDDRYRHAVLNAQRNHSKLGIMICDLNEFKEINDTYGHNFGDEVLKEVSLRLQRLVREGDTVARYGGDEFVVIMEQIECNNKQEIKRTIAEKLDFSMSWNAIRCQVSVSIGYAYFPTDGTTFEQLINRADLRMYDSKRNYYGY